MTSPDLTAANIEKLADLFPTVMTESVNADGNPVRAVDFDLLRQELSDHVVEGPQERYQLDWPGKRAAAFAANAPIAKTLRPVREESVDFDTTRNLFIEGDNLDALKLLQESYLSKVKLIYIDPPYNTGGDFIYDDDFGVTTAAYLHASGQTTSSGTRLKSNPESTGRIHSNWLSFLFPRLKMARSLLRDDGLIMISINDVEAPRLRQLMDEVFGEDNFLAQLVWMKGKEGGNDNAGFGLHHEYVIVYGRTREVAAAAVALDGKDTSRHRTELPEPNRVLTGEMVYRQGEPFQLINLSKQKDYVVQIPLADGNFLEWASYAPQRTIDEFVRLGKIFVGERGVPYVKSFLADEAAGSKPSSIIESRYGTTKAGGIAIRDLFGSGKLFSYPKPPQLLKRLIQVSGATSGDIVMDFFAGSGTTAAALLDLNVEDGLNRRFVVVQIDEPAAPNSEASSSGFADLAALCRERIRRVASRIDESMDVDRGFRVLRVDTANMADILATPDDLEQPTLSEAVRSVKSDRTDEDLLFQVMLDWGLDLAEPIAVDEVGARRVLSVADGALIACFSGEVTDDVVKEVASRHPLRAVFLDSAFVSDAARINAEQIFSEVSPETEVRTI